MRFRKTGKKGIIADLTADISGVLLFSIALLFFLVVFQVKSCTVWRETSFASSFKFDESTYFRSELLKALNSYTELGVKNESLVKNLTMNDLLYLYCNGSQEYLLYNTSNGQLVTLTRNDILNYTFDFFNKSLNLTYEIREPGRSKEIRTRVEVVRIDVYYHDKVPESKMVSMPDLVTDYSIPCFNRSIRLRIGYSLI